MSQVIKDILLETNVQVALVALMGVVIGSLLSILGQSFFFLVEQSKRKPD